MRGDRRPDVESIRHRSLDRSLDREDPRVDLPRGGRPGRGVRLHAAADPRGAERLVAPGRRPAHACGLAQPARVRTGWGLLHETKPREHRGHGLRPGPGTPTMEIPLPGVLTKSALRVDTP